MNEYAAITRDDIRTTLETPNILNMPLMLALMPLFVSPVMIFFINSKLRSDASPCEITIPYVDYILIAILVIGYSGFVAFSNILKKSEGIRKSILDNVSKMNNDSNEDLVMRLVVADRMYMMYFLVPLMTIPMFCGILLMLQNLLLNEFYLVTYFVLPIAVQAYFTFTRFVNPEQYIDRIEKDLLWPLQREEKVRADNSPSKDQSIVEDNDAPQGDEPVVKDNDATEGDGTPNPEESYSVGRRFISFYINNWVHYFSVLLIVYAPLIAFKISTIILMFAKSPFLKDFQNFYAILALPLNILAYFLGSAVIATMVVRQLIRMKADFWESLSTVYARIGSLIASALVTVILFIAGTYVALSVGRVFYLVYLSVFFTLFSFTSIVCVIEKKSGFAAPFRSASFVLRSIGSFVRTYFLICLGCGIIYVLLTEAGWSSIIFEASLFCWPAFLYFDSRKKYEDFSIEEFLKKDSEK